MTTTPGYLRYLPALYTTTDDGFLRQYLLIFEKILSGLDDGQLDGRKGIHELLNAEVIGNLFYARLSFLFPGNTTFLPPISGATPEQESALLNTLNSYIGVPSDSDPLAGYVPNSGASSTSSSAQDPIKTWLNDFLIWLGSWYALVVDNSWSIDKKRNVIMQIMALYRMRGTIQGMSFMLNLLLDLPITVSGNTYNEQGTATPVTGTVSVLLKNPSVAGVVLNDQPGFILQEQYQFGSPVLGGNLPWLFYAELVLPNANNSNFILSRSSVQQIQTLYSQVAQILEKIKPAASHYLRLLTPSMQLQAAGRATQLGVNTLLGDAPL